MSADHEARRDGMLQNGDADTVASGRPVMDALRESEERYRKLFELSKDAIFLLDPEANAVLEVNPAGVAMFGYDSREELLATPLSDFHPSDLDAFLNFVRSVHQEGAGWTDEFACRAKTGDFLTSEVSASSIIIDGRQCLLAAVRDASERKKTEAALRESEERFRGLFTSAPVAVFVCDAAGIIQNFNAEAARIWGREPVCGDPSEKNCGSTLLRLPNGDVLPHGQSPIVEVMRTGKSRYSVEVIVERSDGSQSNVLVNFAPLRNAVGEITGAVTSFVDISDRKRAEDALQQSEARYRHIIESAKEYAIISLDCDGCITSWNSGAERLLGYREEEVVGRSGEILFTPEDRAKGAPEREMQRANENGSAFDERWHMRKDGSRFWGSGFMLRAAGDDGFVKIFRDGTEGRRADERQSLLIEELNHRVKNTLAIVQSLAHQTFRENGALPKSREAFEGRLEALARAHNVLTREHWEAAELKSIACDTLDSCHGSVDQFSIEGPTVRLQPRTAVSMAMALHELCTNATKYGALSVKEGHVTFRWSISGGESPRLLLNWEERGGPPVEAPKERGFGTRMVERALAADLKAEVSLDFRPSGLVCTIDSPLPPQPVSTRADAAG